MKAYRIEVDIAKDGVRHLDAIPFQAGERVEVIIIKEFSTWGLLQAISEEEEAAYLNSLATEGFNTVMTRPFLNP
jgi:hypothetical protein